MRGSVNPRNERVKLGPLREPVRMKTYPPRRPVSVFAEVWASIMDVTVTPILTFAALLKKPGLRIREYLHGTRVSIAGPRHMAFLGVSFFLIVNSFVSTSVSAIFDPFIWFKQWWPLAAPVLLLPASAFQHLLFRRRRLDFGETYAFGLYMLGQIAVFHGALLLLNHATGIGDVQSSTAGYVRAGVIALIEAAYVAWAATDLYEDDRPSVWLRGALAYGGFVAIGCGTVYAIVSYVFLGLFS